MTKNISITKQLFNVVNAFFIVFLQEEGGSKSEKLAKKFEEYQDQLKTEIEKIVPKREKKLKDPNAPKKPLSGYLLFAKDVRKENPETKMATKAIAEMWKELDEGKKAKYNKKSKKASEAYKAQIAEYVRPSEEVLASLEINKKKPRKKREKDPDAPKRPTTAYMFYKKEARGKMKEKYPEMDKVEMQAKIIKKWKKMTDEDKADFNKMAEREKKKYKKALEKYEAGKSGKEDETEAEEVVEEVADE